MQTGLEPRMTRGIPKRKRPTKNGWACMCGGEEEERKIRFLIKRSLACNAAPILGFLL